MSSRSASAAKAGVGAVYDRDMSGASVTLHGVFIEILRLGVLLSGASGVGKSELALELLNRGHRLIADDAPEFYCAESGEVRGRCPEALRDFLEVRGLGVIDVRAVFGAAVMVPEASLQLILHLESMDADRLAAVDRLRPTRDAVPVLGVEVPRITLPVAPGRNLAILAETAVRSHRLARAGHDAAAEFDRRQRQWQNRGEA
jgi:HPr kinase/phosphorylase